MKRPLIKRLYIKYLKRKRKIDNDELARTLAPKIVVIGGGTGLSTMLRGLKKYSKNITAIVTVADDGGSSGMLRQELGILPPGDIRNCITALANTETVLDELLNYRFTEGALDGQSFGNLFLAALNGVSSSFDEAVAKMSDVLAVTGKVLPVTTADVNIKACFEDGSEIIGESKIFYHKKEHDCRIKEVSLVPSTSKALPSAIKAIEEAELIVLGPGSLYTSIIPNLLVDGVVKAIENSTALKCYILNVMTQDGETEGYTAYDHIDQLIKHSSENVFDVCICNNQDISPEKKEKYAKEDATPVYVDCEKYKGKEFVKRSLVSRESQYARHDENKLAYAILETFNIYAPRKGVLGELDKHLMDKAR